MQGVNVARGAMNSAVLVKLSATIAIHLARRVPLSHLPPRSLHFAVRANPQIANESFAFVDAIENAALALSPAGNRGLLPKKASRRGMPGRSKHCSFLMFSHNSHMNCAI
jgi:hypothetical protein